MISRHPPVCSTIGHLSMPVPLSKHSGVNFLVTTRNPKPRIITNRGQRLQYRNNLTGQIYSTRTISRDRSAPNSSGNPRRSSESLQVLRRNISTPHAAVLLYLPAYHTHANAPHETQRSIHAMSHITQHYAPILISLAYVSPTTLATPPLI